MNILKAGGPRSERGVATKQVGFDAKYTRLAMVRKYIILAGRMVITAVVEVVVARDREVEDVS